MTTAGDATTSYARRVVAGEVIAGPGVRAACARHLDDLERGEARGLVWSIDAATRALGFFPTVLCLPSLGEDGASVDYASVRPFELHESQAFIVGSLFGWLREDGSRRFRVGYIEMGKGNGKSPLGAGIGHYMLFAMREPRAEIYVAAAVKDQAKIAYADAVHMVRASPMLSERSILHGEKEVYNIVNAKTGGFFKAISAEKRGLDGKRVHFALLDELHQHPSAEVANKMRAGTKGCRNALVLEITNSGVDRTSICYQHHEYSDRVVRRVIDDDSWFAYVCGMDEADDPMQDPGCWAKANPLLGVTIHADYLEGQVREARGMPANESMVRRLNFCQWVDAAQAWIGQDLWRACEVEPEAWQQPEGEPIAALDLSGTRDMTALALLWPPQEEGGEVRAMVDLWTPKDTLTQRAAKDRVPYDLWANKAHVIATPGRAVSLRWVAERLGDWQQRTGLRRIAFDPWRMPYLQTELQDLGLEFDLVPHGQGFAKSRDSGLWMPQSVDVLEQLVAGGRLRVLRNPALTYASASAVLVADSKENRIFSKISSRARIDGIVALAMAVGLADLGATSSRSVYEDEGLMVL